MSEERLTSDLELDSERTVLRFAGELDTSTAPAARQRIDEALADAPQLVALDLSRLTFMDSTGIWLLVDMHRRARAAGVQLRLGGPPPSAVADALALAGVDELIPTEDGGARPPADEAVSLRLYLSRASSSAASVAQAVREVTERLPIAVEMEVVDVFDEPARAQADRVIATPTLIRTSPPPVLRLIGSLADPDDVLRHLGLGHLTPS